MSWNDDQEFERKWWSDCCNTFTEETKQLTYAYKMGLSCYASYGKWPCYNIDRANVLDIGGGPVSLLLKCENRGSCRVIDPCSYPMWVHSRYAEAGIDYQRVRGEDLRPDERWDEVWIYNVLQHTEQPDLIIEKARLVAPLIRIFEWIDIPPHEGHPQELTESGLNEWLGGKGTTEWLDENGCYGRAYCGIFST